MNDNKKIKTRLKITFVSASPTEEILDLEAFKDRFTNNRWYLFMLDGKAFYTCEHLCWFVSQDGFKDREFIEVKALRALAGG